MHLSLDHADCRWNVNVLEQSARSRSDRRVFSLEVGIFVVSSCTFCAQTGRRVQRCASSKRDGDTRSTWQDDGRDRAHAEDRNEMRTVRGVMLGSVQLSQQLRTSFYPFLSLSVSCSVTGSFPPAHRLHAA